ncbi:hypothetical protein GUITHDRAFT_105692 [Guillardia theta CCMP2712]|uniref:Uncharacterized protein n=1 Tax=Guillardia theta (strain CCMP2712) TaxID=905079 RepID=L1JK68_GUITC|nr:hypothetical protein GUITHDRAFT_105692 [Guillardia theta CCMP2712]EKX48549.1 hypothetical protein GUITHDRAFT_105692 [Guillardia theta CCMP2712]|eukprot:XP_005835529.1 hypothetical protein GUITHDRAFT_105692 [Guillardia theta CCMP2712]
MDKDVFKLMTEQFNELEITLKQISSELLDRQIKLQKHPPMLSAKESAIIESAIVQELKVDLVSARGTARDLELELRSIVEQQSARHFSAANIAQFFKEFEVFFLAIDVIVRNLQETVLGLSSRQVLQSEPPPALGLNKTIENNIIENKKIEKDPSPSEDQFSNFDANPSGHVEYILSEDRKEEQRTSVTLMEETSASHNRPDHDVQPERIRELEKEVERLKKLLDVEAQVSKSRRDQLNDAVDKRRGLEGSAKQLETELEDARDKNADMLKLIQTLVDEKQAAQQLCWEKVEDEVYQYHQDIIQQLIDARMKHAEASTLLLEVKRQNHVYRGKMQKMKEKLTDLEVQHCNKALLHALAGQPGHLDSHLYQQLELGRILLTFVASLRLGSGKELGQKAQVLGGILQDP